MFATKRVRIAAAALTVALLSGGIAAAVTSTASASPPEYVRGTWSWLAIAGVLAPTIALIICFVVQ